MTKNSRQLFKYFRPLGDLSMVWVQGSDGQKKAQYLWCLTSVKAVCNLESVTIDLLNVMKFTWSVFQNTFDIKWIHWHINQSDLRYCFSFPCCLVRMHMQWVPGFEVHTCICLPWVFKPITCYYLDANRIATPPVITVTLTWVLQDTAWIYKHRQGTRKKKPTRKMLTSSSYYQCIDDHCPMKPILTVFVSFVGFDTPLATWLWTSSEDETYWRRPIAMKLSSLYNEEVQQFFRSGLSTRDGTDWVWVSALRWSVWIGWSANNWVGKLWQTLIDSVLP